MAEIIEIITKYEADVTQYKKAVDDLIKEQKTFIAGQDEIQKNDKQGTTALTAAANSRKKLLTEEKARLKELEAGLKTAFNIPQIKVFNEQISQTKNNIALLKGEASKVGAAFNNLKGQIAAIGPAILAGFSIVGLKTFIQEASKVSAQFQAISTAINFVQGSTAKGAEAIDFLRELSQRLGLELLSTAQAFKLFSASAQLGGVSADETKEIFESVATATTALGLSADDAQGVFLALSQIISKGTVAAEELRGQIGERLPGAFELAAKSIGVSTRELNKLLEGGKVLSKEFLPAFAKELKTTFSGALPQAINGAQANFNRLKNITTESLIAVGDIVNKNFLNPLVKGLTALTKIDLSDKLEKERVSLNALVLQITATNNSQQDRLKLIKELQEIYPDFLGNLTAEAVTNEQLRERLKEVNTQLLNKIILQKQQEKINESLAKEADLTIELSEKKNDLAKRIVGLIELYKTELTPEQLKNIDTQDDLISKAQALSAALRQNEAATKRAGELAVISAQSYQRLDGAISGIQSVQSALNKVNKESETLSQERVRLSNELGINLEKEGKAIDDVNKKTEKQVGILEKLRAELKRLKEEREKTTDVARQKDLTTQIKEIERQIAEIEGKANEERIKKAKDLREKLLAEEKKTQDEINKLRIDTAPDAEARIRLQKEFDAKLTQTVAEDLRTQKKIQEDIEAKHLELLVLQNLKAFQEISKIQSGLSFAQDEQNLTDFVNKQTSAILLSGKTLAQQERELTALQGAELQKRLQNARDFTGDKIEQEKLIAKAQEAINAFILEQDKKLAQERLNVAIDLATEQERTRLREAGGGQALINLKKQLLLEKFERDNADAILIEDVKKQIDTISLLRERFANDMADLDKESADLQIQTFSETFNTISDLSSRLFADIAQFQSNQISAQIEELERLNEAQQSFADAEADRITKLHADELISEKDFQTQLNKIEQQRVASEKKIQAEISALKKKQAERDKALAIFNIILNTAQGVTAALAQANPILAAAIAALGAAELALAIATPIPAFKKGTKGKKGSGMALVGEEGEELVNLPHGSQVLPARQTKQHKDIINAMFDNNLEKHIHQFYVEPALRKELISQTKNFYTYSELFEPSQIAPKLIAQKEKHEVEKQKAFAQNIVNSFVTNKNTFVKTDAIDEYGMARVLAKDRKNDKAFADYLAEKIGEHFKEDNRFK